MPEVAEIPDVKHVVQTTSPSSREDLLEWVLPPDPEVSQKKSIEQTVGERFELRVGNIKALIDELSKTHEKCNSLLCRSGIKKCHTRLRLSHWQNILEGCEKSQSLMNESHRTVFELLCEKLESYTLPDLDTRETAKMALGTSKLHLLTVGLRAFIAGDAELGRTWANKEALNCR